MKHRIQLLSKLTSSPTSSVNMASVCLGSASVDPSRNSPPHREAQFSKKKARKGTEGSLYFFVGLSSCHCVGNQSVGVSM